MMERRVEPGCFIGSGLGGDVVPALSRHGRLHPGIPFHDAGEFQKHLLAPAQKRAAAAGAAVNPHDPEAQWSTKKTLGKKGWPAKTCAVCPLRDQCVSKKNKLVRRTLEVSEHHMKVQARRDLCKTPEYRGRMRKRNAVEGTHSELVRGYGLRRCRYTGRSKTDLQALITATVCNLRDGNRKTTAERKRQGGCQKRFEADFFSATNRSLPSASSNIAPDNVADR